jgi:PII-like signaling protein
MNAPVKMLLIFVNEADQLHNRPLCQAIVERLHQLDVAGATTQTASWASATRSAPCCVKA